MIQLCLSLQPTVEAVLKQQAPRISIVYTLGNTLSSQKHKTPKYLMEVNVSKQQILGG
jgi:hypothetical protein